MRTATALASGLVCAAALTLLGLDEPQGYRVPVPEAGTWLITFGIASAPGPFALVAAGAAGTVRQEVEAGRIKRAAILVPVAAGPSTVTVTVESVTEAPVITSVTPALARRETGPPDLVFADDFDGPVLDTAKWVTETGRDGWGNNELQNYTSNPANVSVGTGLLEITAHRDGGDFTSARLNSRFSGTYGRVEARIRPTAGAGLLPAFWMLGADAGSRRWPGCGEIDIMESLGGNEPYTVHATIHGPDAGDQPWDRSTSHTGTRVLADDFHTYALDWWPGLIQMSIDGKVYASYAPEDLAAGEQWVFDKPFYLLLNVAVGGDWPGAPSPSLPFPQTMRVDSVRWWQ
ncbi:glycoside hydrolase family 16 protein [Actinoplanes sp. NPDC051861]|uniref:glycoside hydrolase family 16 protein n=1 Tax=Actinoplanes sp. NPDC051861 TaxID=3155170 RepID=UPI00343B2C9B